MFDCIVLAGGNGSELSQIKGVDNKSLIKIGGREIVTRVVEAFDQAEDISRIALVGPVDQFSSVKKDFPVQMVPESDSILENIVAANRVLQSSGLVLISSADIPLITADAIKDFLTKCQPFDADFYYPIVRKEAIDAFSGEANKTFVSLKEGVFTGGNIFLVNSAKVESSVPVVEQFLQHRKNPLKMVSLLGAAFITRFLSKQLAVKHLEERFSQLLNLEARAVVSSYAELSFDVDKLDDLKLAEKLLLV